MTDGPLKRAFDLLDTDGVVSRELITYRMRNGIMIKETVQRRYTNDDYTDSTKLQFSITILNNRRNTQTFIKNGKQRFIQASNC